MNLDHRTTKQKQLDTRKIAHEVTIQKPLWEAYCEAVKADTSGTAEVALNMLVSKGHSRIDDRLWSENSKVVFDEMRAKVARYDGTVSNKISVLLILRTSLAMRFQVKEHADSKHPFTDPFTFNEYFSMCLAAGLEKSKKQT